MRDAKSPYSIGVLAFAGDRRAVAVRRLGSFFYVTGTH
jgi:hypothetical protein